MTTEPQKPTNASDEITLHEAIDMPANSTYRKPKLSEEMQRQEDSFLKKIESGYSPTEVAYLEGYCDAIDKYMPEVQDLETEIDALKKQNERLAQIVQDMYNSRNTIDGYLAIGDYYRQAQTEGLLK